MDPQPPVIVPVRSAWASRVNQIALAVFGLAVPLGTLAPMLPQPWNSRALAAASLIGAMSIWYFRTFRTVSVTPSAIAMNVSANPVIDVLKEAGVSEDTITDVLNTQSLAQVKQK